MRFPPIVSWLFFLFLLGLDSPLAFALGECEIAREAIETASKIRGLAIKKKVPCLVHDQEQVKQFILEQLHEEIPKERLEAEEKIFKALGLIPEEFEYAKGLVDLYLSQLGGYYDPKREHFVMAGWMPVAMQPAIAAHELTHALQDQYFNLDSFVKPELENSDVQLARSALVEGDATAVMLDYVRGLVGQPPISSIDDVSGVLLQNALGASISAGFSGVPQSLQLFLLFPYSSGLRFAHSKLRQGGYAAINKIFSTPPRSTEEILHPEKYGAAVDFIEFKDEDLLAASGAPSGKIHYRDTYGEFAISVLLGNFIQNKLRATDASNGWGGDKVGIVDQKIVWLTNWDSEKDAREFQELFNETLTQRFQKPSTKYRFAVSEKGRRVTIVIETM